MRLQPRARTLVDRQEAEHGEQRTGLSGIDELAGNGALWDVELFHSPCKESIFAA